MTNEEYRNRGSMGDPPEPGRAIPPSNTIANESDQLAKEIDQLHAMLAALGEKLQPLLRPSGPSDGTSPCLAKPTRSPIAELLYDRVQSVRAAAAMVKDLTARVDL